MKDMNSGKKDDRGTIVIEMCIIMPIVITVIFVVINMMIVQLNNGIATGEAYHVVCNRERYMSGSGNSAEDTLNQGNTDRKNKKKEMLCVYHARRAENRDSFPFLCKNMP